jgi:hypothetical protein
MTTTTEEIRPPTLDHQPSRPDWNCKGCENEWPCDAYKAALRAEPNEYRWQHIMMLATYAQEFVSDRPDSREVDALRRFVTWRK